MIILKRRRMLKKGRMLAILVFVAWRGIFWHGCAEAEEVALIVHKGNATPASLPKEEIKQIFLGQKTRWDDNSVIHFVVCTEETSLLTFLKNYVKKTPIQYQNYWKKLVFSGKGIMPKMFDDTQKVLEFVSSTEGSISFISAQAVDAQRVTIITVSD